MLFHCFKSYSACHGRLLVPIPYMVSSEQVIRYIKSGYHTLTGQNYLKDRNFLAT